MIHHISVAAQNPQHVAQVLAEVIKGKCVPFPPMYGSYMVIAMDEHGTAIEVLPRGTEILPSSGPESCYFGSNSNPSPYTATHVAISVPRSQSEIEAIGQREG